MTRKDDHMTDESRGGQSLWRRPVAEYPPDPLMDTGEASWAA